MTSMHVNRRALLAGSAAIAASGALVRGRPAAAAAPKTGQQVPGLHRVTVGDIEVTAVLDGHLDIPANMFPKADPPGIERLQKDAFAPLGDKLRAPVNGYLVNTGDKLILVDGGTGGRLGPTAGRLADNLKAAGIALAAIDTVLATHLHPDHIGGIFSQDGTALFPNAELVVHEADVAFWTNMDIMAKAPDVVKGFFRIAQGSLKAYEGRVRRVSKDGEVVKGVSAMHLPGHTPGHIGFVAASGNQSLLLWGDIVHAAVLQFAKPDWSIAFDVDMNQGSATRKKVFDMAATDRLLVAGMHLPFPGVGHVAKAGDGYAFAPLEWRYQL